MNEVTNILILISCVLIWIDTDIFIKFRFKRGLNIKPLNCDYCLTFWGSVVLSIVFLNPVYLTATLVLRLINKVI
jgi:hypothetical protein